MHQHALGTILWCGNVQAAVSCGSLQIGTMKAFVAFAGKIASRPLFEGEERRMVSFWLMGTL